MVWVIQFVPSSRIQFKNRRNSSTRVSSALSPSTVEPMTTASASLSASTLSLDLPILEENPYAGHPELSGLEASVLWEYAKMAGIVKQLAATTRNLANTPANDLLATMRTVESQMGLVLTLSGPPSSQRNPTKDVVGPTMKMCCGGQSSDVMAAALMHGRRQRISSETSHSTVTM
ncbi:hypothetical protein FRB97_005322 [Tulasnella sp. 331]|nr:hypothetical protein FRB97_005322 [Tulasnella sp. 331]